MIRQSVQVLELIISYAVVNICPHRNVLQSFFASSTIIAACEAKDAVALRLAHSRMEELRLEIEQSLSHSLS